MFFIERQVQAIKNLLSKCAKDGSDPYLALLQLRSTPLDSRTPSPDELLQNRQLRTTLPVIIRHPANSEAVRAALQSRQVYTSHDAHAKELSKLSPTQPVLVRNTLTEKWEKGVIKSQAETPTSYIVITPQGEKGEMGTPERSSNFHQYSAQGTKCGKGKICVISSK